MRAVDILVVEAIWDHWHQMLVILIVVSLSVVLARHCTRQTAISVEEVVSLQLRFDRGCCSVRTYQITMYP